MEFRKEHLEQVDL